MKKQLIGTCVDNPFRNLDKLNDVIDNATEISKRTFLKNADVDDYILLQMRKFPRDYRFYKSGNIYFYVWSCIEHFYA